MKVSKIESKTLQKVSNFDQINNKHQEWKEKFRQEGRNALQNDKVPFDDAKRPLNWTSITRSILNQHAPEHQIFVKKESPKIDKTSANDDQDQNEDMYELKEKSSLKYHKRHTKFRFNLHRHHKSNDKRNTQDQQASKSSKNQCNVKGSIVLIEDDPDYILPEKLTSLKNDIDKLVADQNISRQYFERFKREREEKIQALKRRNLSLQRVNIDDAVLGNNYHQIKHNDHDSIEIDLKAIEETTKIDDSKDNNSKFVKQKSLMAEQRQIEYSEYLLNRSSLANFKFENSLKFKARQQIMGYLESFDKITKQNSTNASSNQVNFPLIYNNNYSNTSFDKRRVRPVTQYGEGQLYDQNQSQDLQYAQSNFKIQKIRRIHSNSTAESPIPANKSHGQIKSFAQQFQAKQLSKLIERILRNNSMESKEQLLMNDYKSQSIIEVNENEAGDTSFKLRRRKLREKQTKYLTQGSIVIDQNPYNSTQVSARGQKIRIKKTQYISPGQIKISLTDVLEPQMKLVEKLTRDGCRKQSRSKSPHKKTTMTTPDLFSKYSQDASRKNSKQQSEKISPKFKSNQGFSTTYSQFNISKKQDSPQKLKYDSKL
ncbi:UNKNOWN [Stylonychia lemnae]|uniref:Uncharacterized protein n=1 Tax=Stylonychia lemnae TaxID=5949 RepID=A0A078B6H3_STYLE|nr:UNKNOWN [Stylonychia lemnae]|eukprot:CDW89974.1 UNKNOWN [Stylonychia lemnae]